LRLLLLRFKTYLPGVDFFSPWFALRVLPGLALLPDTEARSFRLPRPNSPRKISDERASPSQLAQKHAV